MEITTLLTGLIIGVAMGGAGGAVAVWFTGRGRSQARASEAACLEQALSSEVARLEQAVEYERERAEEKARYVASVEARLGETIEAAASRAVKGNNEEFLALAGQRLEPVDQRLRELEEHLRQLENARQGAYGSLHEQVKGLVDAQEILRTETVKLSTALSKPGVRGRWGEMTLRRLVEMAGLVEHCNFAEREAVGAGEERRIPDLAVRLPGDTVVAVDSKAPLDSYLSALEATDPAVRDRKLDEHAQAIRGHMVSLGRKGYWEHYDQSPDFTVMFVPGEVFVAAAAERQPNLFEDGFRHGVILATPTTLMALLRVVALGWRQQVMADSAKEVAELGRELHKRIASMAKNVSDLGNKLGGAVSAYNKTVGSLERNVLPQARRFDELGAGSASEIRLVPAVDEPLRALTAPEFVDADGIQELERRVGIDDEDYGTLGRIAP